jgi:hypothetical protein
MIQKNTSRIGLITLACFAVCLLCRADIPYLSADSCESVFEQLKSPEAVADDAYRKQLIHKFFLAEPASSIPFVLKKLWTGPSSHSPQHRQSHEMDCYIVRTILAEMPVEVQEVLVSTKTDTPNQKARLLETMGMFKTPLAFDGLRESLSDQRLSNLGAALYGGWPYRVCDIAYNTLILRLRLTDFRAPLGVNHSYAQRNRWIRRLEDWLGANSEEAAEVFSNHP